MTGLIFLAVAIAMMTAVAGYVHAASGKRYVLVAIVNHPNASAARPAFDALIEWTANEH